MITLLFFDKFELDPKNKLVIDNNPIIIFYI